jgi:hypothetical protein
LIAFYLAALTLAAFSALTGLAIGFVLWGKP